MSDTPPRACPVLARSPDARGGAALIVAAIAALLCANGPFAADYFALLAFEAGPLSVHHWINDVLMTLFFFGVGLEIKRECVSGALSSAAARSLPVIVAVAGMAVPAIVFCAIAGGDPGSLRGWAIPVATDIAFALGILALVGRHIPPSLRLFLAAVAIADDIGAVAIIALFYTPSLAVMMLVAAVAILIAMGWIARRKVDVAWPYLLLAVLLWFAVYRSGIHPTVAGVLAALMIPARAGRTPGAEPVLQRLEHGFQPILAYAVIPLFGFANAGVALFRLGWSDLFGPLPVGIALGLFVGKQAGIMLGMVTARLLGVAARPAGATRAQLYGVALLCGIGFTMSLFIGGLAFTDPTRAEAVKAGVLGGSLLSAVAGFLVLRFARPGAAANPA